MAQPASAGGVPDVSAPAWSAFANRLRKNARHLRKWARRLSIACYRVYDCDIPEFAYAVDLYADWVHLQAYERPGASDDRPGQDDVLRQAVAEALQLEPAHVVLKRRAQRRGQEQHEKTGQRGHDLIVEEGGRRFLVNLEAYLDTGLFLDHRNTRALVAAEAGGKRMLNLFCYTGSFTVYAATAGAASTLSVDLSNTYLDWARRNLELNGVDLTRHRLLRADVRRWLPQAAAEGKRFDLIVLDPPAFSTSKAMSGVLDIQRDYPELIAGCAGVLAPGGTLYFSTNLQSFRFDTARTAGFAAEEISHRTVPEDFRNRRIHRCWRLREAFAG
jgi:23S rRNA (cytosine1962-C5)-methyltransferase